MPVTTGAGVDADPNVDVDRVPQLLGRAHRPQRVVLAHDRDAEDGHHRIADELLERPAVPLDRHPRHVEVARHHRPQRLRVEPLPEGGRPGDVAEEDGDGLPLLSRLRRSGERRAAGVAEARTLPVLGAAARAGHARTIGGLG